MYKALKVADIKPGQWVINRWCCGGLGNLGIIRICSQRILVLMLSPLMVTLIKLEAAAKKNVVLKF